MSEMPPKSIENIVNEHQEKREKTRKRPYKCSILEKPGTSKIPKFRRKQKIPVKYLRKDPAIIPLEATIPQSDPRSDRIISWIDVAEELDLPVSKPKLPENTRDSFIKESPSFNSF